jgi:hypothetical protein
MAIGSAKETIRDLAFSLQFDRILVLAPKDYAESSKVVHIYS